MTIEPNEYKILKDEHKELKHRLYHLAHTNTELTNENYKLQNRLIEQQLNEYDKKDYINRLKQELFDLYLKHYN